MSEYGKKVSRRTLLIGAAGALPLIALGATGAKAAKMAQTAVRYQTLAEGRQAVQRLQPVHRAERLQDRRRDDFPVRLVRALGQEGRLTSSSRVQIVNEK